VAKLDKDFFDHPHRTGLSFLLHWPFEMTNCLFFSPASYYVAAPLSLASSSLPEAIQYLQYQIAEFIVKGRARMPDLVIDPSHLLKPVLKLA